MSAINSYKNEKIVKDKSGNHCTDGTRNDTSPVLTEGTTVLE